MSVEVFQLISFFFFFQAEDGIRDYKVTGVQTCALPICKSSLAFGTLYAEAQRRYFESVAPYARRLIDQVGVPQVDGIDGLPPAVALQQHRGAPTARSSVGSVTTLSNLVRMLYSRAGAYPAHQPMLYAEDFSPNTPQGACPDRKSVV